MHVLSVSSLKGGVGKTTVTLGLTSAAFTKGLRTLVVDLDPQSDVSTGMDIQVAGHLNVADVLASPKEKTVRAAIAPSGWTRGRTGTIDVMVGSPSAINFDGPHPSIRDIWKLEEALASVEHDYDLVLIDCPPALGLLTVNGLVAADWALISSEAQYFALQGVQGALDVIEQAKEFYNPDLELLGIVMNIADMRTVHSRETYAALTEAYGDKVFDTVIRQSIRYAESAERGLSIVDYRPDLGADYVALAEEVLDRVGLDTERERVRQLRSELVAA